MVETVDIAIALDRGTLHAWEGAVLDSLARMENVRLHLLELQADRPVDAPSLYRFYEALDNRLFGMFADPCEKFDLDESWLRDHAVKVVEHCCSSTPPRFDAIVAFEAVLRQAQTLAARARHGVLFLDAVDGAGRSLRPFGFHEVMQRRKTSTVVVRQLTRDGGRRVLRSSRTSTDAISARRNRERMLWKAQYLLPQAIREWLVADKAADTLNEHAGIESLNHPASLPLAAMLLRKLPDIFLFYYHAKLTWEQWYLMFQRSERAGADLNGFTTILPPRDRIWADPHLFHKDGTDYVFIEEMLFAENKGFISVLQIDDDGNWTRPVKVLEQDYHLSYPQVFEWQGEIYMLPESSANRTVELYRCVSFPDQWELEATLLQDIEAVDASLLRHQGKWWLFCSIKPHAAASENDELHIFSSEDLCRGPWLPHRGNPVITDVTRARPAGRCFSHDGRMIRPSQNCAGIYGFGFNLNQIRRLDDDAYEEKWVAGTDAAQYRGMIATHTYAREGDLSVVDACRRISRLPGWFRLGQANVGTPVKNGMPARPPATQPQR